MGYTILKIAALWRMNTWEARVEGGNRPAKLIMSRTRVAAMSRQSREIGGKRETHKYQERFSQGN